MVVGTARGNRSRIGDFYAHGRSTPMYDSFYGGKENLLGAYGYEENGYTTIIFRKKMSGKSSIAFFVLKLNAVLN